MICPPCITKRHNDCEIGYVRYRITRNPNGDTTTDIIGDGVCDCICSTAVNARAQTQH